MDPLTAEHVVAVAKAIFETADVCFLITQGEGGGSSARLMQHFTPEADLTLWFGTSAASRKVHELRSSPRASMACQDPRRPAYTVLGGVVTVEEWARQWWRYWRHEWQTLWPDGPMGADYLLLRFACERVEVLSVEAGMPPPPYGWRAAVVVRRGAGWQLERG
jgi:general stress protein 26